MNEDLFFELVQKYLRGDISTEESTAMQDAMETNKDLQHLFQYISQTSVPRHTAQALDTHIHKILHPPKKSFRLSQVHYIALAASLTIFFIFFSYFYMRQESSDYRQLYATQNGERKHAVLPDGTEVWLNSGSSIHIKPSFAKTDRDIKLQGEAFFAVEKNKNLPMFIQTKQILIKVVGTSFNVRAYADEPLAETSLMEGKIELYLSATDKNSEKLNMEPGQKVIFSSLKASLAAEDLKIIPLQQESLPRTAIQTEIAWKENTLAFDNEPIALAIPKLEKWFNEKIILQNQDLAHIKFSGTFKDTPLEDVLNILQMSGLNFQYSRQDEKIIIH